MGVAERFEESLAAKYGLLFPHLDERQRRLVMGADARSLGHGGIRVVARAAGVAGARVSLGVRELESGAEPLGRARRPGGGRKRVAERDRELVPALLALVEPDMRGDPMSPLRWTTRSARHLAGELTGQGHRVPADTVGDLLREQGFSLQGNAKTIEGRRQHPDRDAQFRCIGAQAKEHMAAGQPVISVDARKKEKAGNYAQPGREWRRKGDPVAVRDHDFPDPLAGQAVPYGIYDMAANTGWVSVGTDGNTAAFAVEPVRRWWQAAGQPGYRAATRMLITADAGGSSGYRTRAWKAGLAALSAETGLDITCCHFPPGTSKWNKIEHRLFSHISMNWRGRPLTSHEVIVATIAATTTATGLAVRAELDTGLYPTGVKISDQQLAALPVTGHSFHPAWNYTIHHHPAAPAPVCPPRPAPRARRPRCTQDALASPAVTGMPRAGLAALATALATAWNARREAASYLRRGGPRHRSSPACDRYNGHLDLTGQILVTLIHHRLALPRYLIAPLSGAGPDAIADAINLTRPLLSEHLPAIQPPAARAAALRQLCQHAETAGASLPAKIKTTRY